MRKETRERRERQTEGRYGGCEGVRRGEGESRMRKKGERGENES